MVRVATGIYSQSRACNCQSVQALIHNHIGASTQREVGGATYSHPVAVRWEGLLTAIQRVHTHNYMYMPLELYVTEVGVVRCFISPSKAPPVHKCTRSRAFLRSTVYPDNLAAQIVSVLYITPNLASNKHIIYS